MMHSLRARLTVFVVATILVCVGVTGVISFISIRNTAERTSDQIMRLLCENKTREMNDYMDGTQQSINIIAKFLKNDISEEALIDGGVIGAAGYGKLLENRDWDSEQQRKLDAYLHEKMAGIQMFMQSFAEITPNVSTYYFRLNPELSEEEIGFLYAHNGDSDFIRATPTDILAYDKDDIGHVGWYYQTLERGKAGWVDPYMDENLGQEFISYLAPISIADTFIGVVGMDISFDNLVSYIRDFDIYETGYAFLADSSGKIFYHPAFESGSFAHEIDPKLSDLEALLLQNGKTNNDYSMIEYSYDGSQKKATSSVLHNGLLLYVTAPVNEINADWQQLIRMIMITVIVLVLLFVGLVAIFIRRITEPLKNLKDASEKIADGNYDVNLPYEGDDEIGVLTKSVRHLVAEMKIYIDDLNSKAYKDPLTHVKNKAAFELWCRQINETLKSSDDNLVSHQFAILMFDCNMLKEINDEYGHPNGDIYLKNGAAVICKTFAHSPVFRVGGDEFVVILQGDEYKNREQLMREFQEKTEEMNNAVENPWERVNMAMGISIFNPRLDESVESVYNRADKAMYENKREWKEKEGFRE